MSGGLRLTCATFNIRFANRRDGWHRWELRRRVLHRLIDALGCDVLGLQEVLPVQRSYLSRRPGDRDWYGVGRDDGVDAGEQSPIVVDRRVLQVDDAQTRWLSQSPDVAGSRGWDARLPRLATVCRATVVAHPQVRVGIVNTHLDHKGATARLRSAELIAEICLAEPDRAWIVMGDLNTAPGSDPLGVLADAGLRDVLPADAGGTVHGWTGARGRRRIDYILVDERWQVERAEVVYRGRWPVLPSDHWPVRAVLRHAG